MIGFIARRMAQALVALLSLTVIVFIVSRSTGSPLSLLLSPQATAEDFARLEAELGLDRSLFYQYWIFITQLIQGDLGTSIRSGEPVATLVRERLPASAILAACSITLSLSIAVPLGVIAAIRRGSVIDTCITSGAVLAQSMPAFWVGIVLIQSLAVRLEWFPAGNFRGVHSLVLPSVTLAIFGLGALTRLMRTSMLEVLEEEYMTFAYLKGVPRRLVLLKHGVRTALLPIVTYSGIYIAAVFTLAVVVEAVFNWPGLGRLAYTAITHRDYPVVQAVVLFSGVIVIAINFCVDLLYMWLDPRVRIRS